MLEVGGRQVGQPHEPWRGNCAHAKPESRRNNLILLDDHAAPASHRRTRPRLDSVLINLDLVPVP